MLPAIFIRLTDFFHRFPVRFYRLVLHFISFEKLTAVRSVYYRIVLWPVLLIVHFLDLLGFGEWMECLFIIFKKNGRKLLEEEKVILEKYFGSVEWANRIFVSEHRKTGTQKGRVKYVTAAIINSLGPIPKDVMVHELVHVWQYFEKGLCYIPLALYAQTTKEGYDYGGRQALEQALQKSKPFQYFNWEQQASLVQDHYRGSVGLNYQYAGKYDDKTQELLTSLLKREGFLTKIKKGDHLPPDGRQFGSLP